MSKLSSTMPYYRKSKQLYSDLYVYTSESEFFCRVYAAKKKVALKRLKFDNFTGFYMSIVHYLCCLRLSTAKINLTKHI